MIFILERQGVMMNKRTIRVNEITLRKIIMRTIKEALDNNGPYIHPDEPPYPDDLIPYEDEGLAELTSDPYEEEEFDDDKYFRQNRM